MIISRGANITDAPKFEKYLYALRRYDVITKKAK